MLDEFDIRLLAAVQADSEMTQAELSEKVNLSPTQCARRLDRLRKENYVERAVAILNPAQLGFKVVAHTAVRLNAHTEEGNRQLLRFIESAPEILECYSQTGDADFLMKIVVRDLDQLSAFVDRMIRSTGGLASIRSAIVLKTIKNTTELPLQLVT